MAYARARWYDARNATWLSEDPLADVDSPNLYAFVGLGDVKDWQEAVTGTDLITGRKLSNLERGITVAAAFIPIVGGSVLRNMFGESAEHLAKEGAEVLEEEAEQGLKRAGHLAEEEAEQGIKRASHLAEEETEKSLRRGSDVVDEVTTACRRACFAEGTLVSTPSGEVPIEQIAVGDQVYSYDEETGEEHPAEVVALHHRDVTELWLLQVGGETIETTDEHPFYVVGQGWTRAKGLQEGDVLIATSGNRLPLEKVERVEQTARVYNFEVRDLHTYLVGRVGAVVHNCGARKPGGYETYDIDDYERVSPGANRAPGHSRLPADGQVQGHHIIQNEWAERNVANYKKGKAPAILLPSDSGKAHAIISARQAARRQKRLAQGLPAFSSSIREEFENAYQDLLAAGVSKEESRRAMREAYKYFKSLKALP